LPDLITNVPELLSNVPDLTIDLQHFAVKCAFYYTMPVSQRIQRNNFVGHPDFELLKCLMNINILAAFQRNSLKPGWHFSFILITK
jgi:hypothetical protein